MNSEFLETIRVVDKKACNLEYHQKRYESVLKSFGIKEYKNLFDYIDPPDSKLYRCRVVYNVNDLEDIRVEYIEYVKRSVKKLKLVYDDHIDYKFKSTDRECLENHYKNKENCDDVLIIKNSFVTDTSIANIAFYDGSWKTPSKPLLKGTTRQRYLDQNKITEADIKVDELSSFTKVALLNAMIDFDIIADENIKDVFC
jgi:4-amino-4-deoxychorismate lyase